MPQFPASCPAMTAIVGLLIAAGCSPTRPVSLRPESQRPISVRTVAAVQADVPRTTSQPATVHAYFRSEVRAQATGYIKELKAEIGDYVDAGDVLAVVDVPEIQKRREVVQAKVVRLTAQESRATAGIQLAEAQVNSAKAQYHVAEAQLKESEAMLAAAEAEFSRTEDLVRRGSLQDRMLDEVRKKRDSSLAAKTSVASAIDSAKADVIVAEAQAAAAKADLQAARAETEIARREIEQLDVMIEFATLRSPVTGVVSHRGIEPGDLLGG
ncbi:MAG: biotin/lipoyl-binding protein, partial [Planctomycetota bacterium]